MSALPPIATAKADSRKGACPLYPRMRTCALQLGMSAMGQKRTFRPLFLSGKIPKSLEVALGCAHPQCRTKEIHLETRKYEPPGVAALAAHVTKPPKNSASRYSSICAVLKRRRARIRAINAC